MTEPTAFCVLCPDRERLPRRPPVCDACRAWLASIVLDVGELAATLAAGPDLRPDLRPGLIADPDILERTGRRIAWRDLDDKLILRPRDQIAAVVPSGSAGNKVGAGPLSGSKAPRLPIDEDAVDILGRARQGSRAPFVRGVTGADPEQVGHLPLATTLDTWVRDWARRRTAGENLADARVEPMARWLHARVEWACDVHPRIDEFADEIREYRSAMRGLLRIVDVPDYLAGVACPKCGASSLFRRHGGPRDGSLWVECGECPTMLSPTEYQEHTEALQAKAVDTTRAMVAVALLARSKPSAGDKPDAE